MKNNRDTRDNISPGVKCQYIPPPNSPKLNGNGNGKEKHTHRGYFKVPDAIYEFNLNSYERDVFLYLCRRANREGTCFPSQKRIANDLGVSRMTVARAIKELVSQNLIQVEKITGDKFRYNQYRILLKSGGGGVCNSQIHTYVTHSYTKGFLKEKELNNYSSSNSLCTGGNGSKLLKGANTNEHKINISFKEKATSPIPREKKVKRTFRGNQKTQFNPTPWRRLGWEDE